MTEELRERYFYWLYDMVCPSTRQHGFNAYTIICNWMQNIPFKEIVDHDDNRSQNGRDLRAKFLESVGNTSSIVGPCSIFEMLVALAEQATFLADKTPPFWFAIFLKNLGLDGYVDNQIRPPDTFSVRRIIEKFNNRTYRPNGEGGLFPLHHTTENQRKVQIWYQLGAYINENKLY
jgi:hypothetical protein